MAMRPVSLLVLGVLTLAGCEDDPLTSRTPGEPPPPAQGIQAFIQVDDDRAQPGDVVRVWVKVQIGGETDARLGSYTGRLRFDPAALDLRGETAINDGMRVTNPAGAAQGDLRFAGASPAGFQSLTLYEATFEVTKPDYMDGLRLEMEEVSAALSLTNLTPTLRVAPRVFLRVE
jgi:hypothetical protein